MFRRLILSIFTLISLSAFAGSLDDGIELLQSGITFYQDGDYTSSYNSIKESIPLLQLVENGEADEWLLNTFFWAGAASYHLGKNIEAEEYYLKSLEIAEYYNSTQYQSNIISALANLKYSLSDYSEAGDWYIKSSGMLKILDLNIEAIAALEYGAYSKVLAEEYSLAYEIYDDVLKNYSSEKQDHEMAVLYAMLGNCSYYLSDLDGALSFYKQASTLMEQYGSTIQLSQFYGWVGKIYFDSALNEFALSYFNKSLDMSRELNSLEDESRVLGYLGFLYSSISDYDKGASYYEKSLEVAKIIGQTQFIIAAYESLDWIYDKARDEEKLIEIKKLLVDLYEQQNYESRLIKVCNKLGYILYGQEKYEEAIPFYEKSINRLRSTPDNGTLITSLTSLGMTYKRIGNEELSEKYLNESLSENLKSRNISDAEIILSELNVIYSNDADYYSLIDALERFIPVYRSEHNLQKLMYLLNYIGNVYKTVSDYNNAIKYFTKAKELGVQLDDKLELCISLINIAMSKASLSLFDEALEINEQALDIAAEYSLITAQASIWNNLGELYRAWGWHEKSLTCYYNAEIIYKKEQNKEGTATVYNNIGQVLRTIGKQEDSILYFKKALEINIEVMDKKTQAINLSNLGEAYRELKDNEKAIVYYSKALQIDIELKNLQGIHIRKNNIAILDIMSGKYQKAIESFNEGLKYWQYIGDRRQESIALQNIGFANAQIGDFEIASRNYIEVIKIQEQLRLTAKGSIRREYLESQIQSYRNLSAIFNFMEDPLNALYFMELSRGKYLIEQMNITDTSQYDWSTYRDFILHMKKGSALLSYTVIDENVIQAILIDNGIVSTTLINIEKQFVDTMFTRFGSLINRYVDGPIDNKFDAILKLYRILLSRPIQNRVTNEAIDIIGRHLYSKLINPFTNNFEDITQLIIVPDGILGTIPFEVLKDEEGVYLIENYDISYTQSLALSQMIKNRIYDKDREPLLAFGGAIYTDYVNIDNSDYTFNRQDILEKIRSGSDTRKAYSGMGLGSWQNLPGTLKEVNKLSEIVPKSKIITGADVTEENVFDKSNSGELANYKVIHFATHGIVVPEIPELSAVVLSQTSNNSAQNDGYLTMSEIASLNIKADFVNLSACETGLGKIYEGEGVVGLTQAFLIAGANALSVSLWQVSDDSTMEFMTGVYTLVEEKGLSYSQAISEMKRVFLKDDLYKNPFYWAPFVLYGDYEAGL